MVGAIDGAAQRHIGQRARLRQRASRAGGRDLPSPGASSLAGASGGSHVAHQRDRGRRIFESTFTPTRSRLHAGADVELPAHPGRRAAARSAAVLPGRAFLLHQRAGDFGEPHRIAFIDCAGAHAQRHDGLGRDAIRGLA